MASDRTSPQWLNRQPELGIPRLQPRGGFKVVPYNYVRGPERPVGEPRRSDGEFACFVVASDHPSYTSGGHAIAVAHQEIRRGHKVEITADMGR